MPPLPAWMADLASKSDMGPSAKEKAERDARWIGDFSDDLTVAIALREWDDAVALVEKGESRRITICMVADHLLQEKQNCPKSPLSLRS